MFPLLEIENSFLKGEIKALKENPRNTINGNVVIFPSAYGKENVDHIFEKLGDIFWSISVKKTISKYTVFI